MDPHALLLARLQFAFTISFHIIFPAFSIGLSAFIATLLVLWRRTGREHYHRLARFWTKIFAVSFAMGVVSGIPLSYEFGTNWSRFSVVTGNVIGPLIGYEVLTAFFLEASFLGVMLFGWQRVKPWLHLTAAILVALGTAISGFWILSANSWMHTPAGYEMHGGVAVPVDWLQVIFNPSFPYRFAHMMTAAYLTTSVVVLATGARYMLAGKFEQEARTMLHMGIGMVAILGPVQLLLGDQHGLNTLKYQPIKIAALEAHWENDGPADFVVFALPDEKHERNRAAITIPHLGSLILTHDWNGRFAGLKDVPPALRPAGDFDLFRLSADGRDRAAADCLRSHRRGAVVAQAAVHHSLVPANRPAGMAGGLSGDPGRMADHRERPATLHRLWDPPHGPGALSRCGLDGRDVARGVRAGVHRRVLDRHPLHLQAHRRERTGRRGARAGDASRGPPQSSAVDSG